MMLYAWLRIKLKTESPCALLAPSGHAMQRQLNANALLTSVSSHGLGYCNITWSVYKTIVNTRQVDG